MLGELGCGRAPGRLEVVVKLPLLGGDELSKGRLGVTPVAVETVASLVVLVDPESGQKAVPFLFVRFVKFLDLDETILR